MAYDLGEIACKSSCTFLMLFSNRLYWQSNTRMGDARERAISESHKHMHLTPGDDSSADLFSPEPELCLDSLYCTTKLFL